MNLAKVILIAVFLSTAFLILFGGHWSLICWYTVTAFNLHAVKNLVENITIEYGEPDEDDFV